MDGWMDGWREGIGGKRWFGLLTASLVMVLILLDDAACGEGWLDGRIIRRGSSLSRVAACSERSFFGHGNPPFGSGAGFLIAAEREREIMCMDNGFLSWQGHCRARC